MANYLKPKVFLGFEDEVISKKYQTTLSYSTNKVGGSPDWIENKESSNPLCQLCGLTLPLIVQIYAPLDKSPYHRTLYLFGCINPNCWNQMKSWVCLRSQIIDSTASDFGSNEKTFSSFDWCEGANDWEDEKNGNLIQARNEQVFQNENTNITSKLAALDIDTCQEELPPVGAMGNPFSFSATAEIEGDEDEVITIDSPCLAQSNVAELLDQVKPVPQVPSETLQFVSFFITVSEEDQNEISNSVTSYPSSQVLTVDESNVAINKSLEVEDNSMDTMEKYEKTLPAHGDKLFHQFISRIQRNPGQILRYIRDGGLPLFLYPIADVPLHCQHCQGNLVYELQLLPTLISRLQLVGSSYGHMEFGTIFVLACQRSCWSPEDTVRSEYVLIQREM